MSRSLLNGERRALKIMAIAGQYLISPIEIGSYPVKSGVTIAKVHSKTFLPEWMNSKTVYSLMAGNERKLFGQFPKGSVMKGSSHVLFLNAPNLFFSSFRISY